MDYDSPRALFADIADSVRSRSGDADIISRQDIPDVIRGLNSNKYTIIGSLSDFLSNGRTTRLLDHILSDPDAENGITNISSMFSKNNAITEFDFTKYPKLVFGSTSKANTFYFRSAFWYCHNLVKADMRFNIKEGCRLWWGDSSADDVFNNCESLKEVILPEFEFYQNSTSMNLFGYCTSLEAADTTKLFSPLFQITHSGMFAKCSNLKKIWIPKEALSKCIYKSSSIFFDNSTTVPFENLVIYTDFPDIDTMNDHLGAEWKFASDSVTIDDSQIRFGATHEEYLAAPPTEGGVR